jgi:hypothetical protein
VVDAAMVDAVVAVDAAMVDAVVAVVNLFNHKEVV